jgi:hypothetical protein
LVEEAELNTFLLGDEDMNLTEGPEIDVQIHPVAEKESTPDSLIMEGIQGSNLQVSETYAITRCRLHLWSQFLSDISYGPGIYLLQEVWTGAERFHPNRKENWPLKRQTKSAALVLRKRKKLKIPLGGWRRIEKGWEWFSPQGIGSCITNEVQNGKVFIQSMTDISGRYK